MKILHIAAYPPTQMGGLELYVRYMATHLKKHGVESEILTTDRAKPFYHEEYVDGIKVIFLSNYGELWAKNPIFNIITYLVRNHKKYDLFHIHSYLHFSSIQAIFISKILRRPSIVTLHGGVQTSQIKGTSFSENLQILFKHLIFDKTVGKFVIDNCSALISVSKSDLLAMNRVFSSGRRNYNFWIPNAINIPPPQKNDFTRKYITFIGRLTSIKGFDLFINMMLEINKIIPKFPILVVGKGVLDNLIHKYKNELNITYIPEIPNEKIFQIYYQTKIFVLPSRFEGLPTTLLESMVYDTPIVSTNVGGIPDLIKNQYNGLLYEPNDIKQGIKHILNLLKDTTLQQIFIKNGQYIIHSKFSWDRIILKNIQVYKRILGISQKKNLLLISEYYPPDQVGASTRISILLQELVKKHNVTVITGCPHYPKPENEKNSPFHLFKIIREHKNLMVIRIWMPTFRMGTNSGRILNYLWFTFSFILGLPYVSKPDLIWSTSPNIFCGFTARIAKKIFDVPSIANVDDIWPEAPIQLGFLETPLLRYISGQIGTHAFDFLDGITTISETITRFYRKRYHIKKVYTVPVGIEHNRLMNIIEMGQQRLNVSRIESQNKEQKNKIITFMYSGILGPAYDFPLLINAFKQIELKYPVKLIIRGTGPEKYYIKGQMKKYNPKNVSLETQYLSTVELNEKLLSADIFVLPMRENFISTTALPTKLFEYMAIGKPVILYGIGEPKWLVEKANCGIVCPNGGLDNFANAFELMLNSQDKWRSFGENGQKYILENFSSRSIIKYVYKMFEDLNRK